MESSDRPLDKGVVLHGGKRPEPESVVDSLLTDRLTFGFLDKHRKVGSHLEVERIRKSTPKDKNSSGRLRFIHLEPGQ